MNWLRTKIIAWLRMQEMVRREIDADAVWRDGPRIGTSLTAARTQLEMDRNVAEAIGRREDTRVTR
jgi:hypothetical protein